MSRPNRKPKQHQSSNGAGEMLSFLRNEKHMAIQASTDTGRANLRQWRATLQGLLDEHRAMVRDEQEAIDLIDAALGEVSA